MKMNWSQIGMRLVDDRVLTLQMVDVMPSAAVIVEVCWLLDA